MTRVFTGEREWKRKCDAYIFENKFSLKKSCILNYDFQIMYVFTQPLYRGQDGTQGDFFHWSKAGLNSDFLKNPRLVV